MTQQIAQSNLVRIRFSDLQQNPIDLAIFKRWVTNMTMERDGFCGVDRTVDGKFIPGFWTWINWHDASPEFHASDLYGTFVWVHWFSRVVIATGTITPGVDIETGIIARDDRSGDGFWGGVNVRHDLRGMGIGPRICKELDDHVATHAKTQPRLFHLCTANPIAERMCIKLGYERNATGDINTARYGNEPLYSKHYGIE
jgi:hypothetical protein